MEVAAQVLGGRYELVDPLGNGGMAVVWRARDNVLGRFVAVKLLAGRHAGSLDARRRIRAEARAAAVLSHPNIAQVYDYGEWDDAGTQLPYVVMELVRGVTLQQRQDAGPMSARFSMRVCAEVAAALAAAHAEGLVHRDIKPANVMVTPDGVKVVDFGIAAAISPSGATEPDGEVLGTPAYLAPERLTDDAVEPASDVYALGVLLYRLLSGESPWSADTTTQMLNAHISIEPAPLMPVRGVPDYVIDLCNRCLSKDPTQRPSAREAAALLARGAGLRVVEDDGASAGSTAVWALDREPSVLIRAARAYGARTAGAGAGAAGSGGAGSGGAGSGGAVLGGSALNDAGPSGTGPYGAGVVGAGPDSAVQGGGGLIGAGLESARQGDAGARGAGLGSAHQSDAGAGGAGLSTSGRATAGWDGAGRDGAGLGSVTPNAPHLGPAGAGPALTAGNWPEEFEAVAPAPEAARSPDSDAAGTWAGGAGEAKRASAPESVVAAGPENASGGGRPEHEWAPADAMSSAASASARSTPVSAAALGAPGHNPAAEELRAAAPGGVVGAGPRPGAAGARIPGQRSGTASTTPGEPDPGHSAPAPPAGRPEAGRPEAERPEAERPEAGRPEAERPERSGKRLWTLTGAVVVPALAVLLWFLLPGGPAEREAAEARPRATGPGASAGAAAEASAVGAATGSADGPAGPGAAPGEELPPAGGPAAPGGVVVDGGGPAVTPGATATADNGGAGPDPTTKAPENPDDPGDPGPDPDPTTDPPDEPELQERTFTSAGGTVRATCASPGTARLLSWTPTKPYKVEEVDAGPAAVASVLYKHGNKRVRMSVTCSGGVPAQG